MWVRLPPRAPFFPIENESVNTARLGVFEEQPLFDDLHQKFIAQAAASELEAGNYWLSQIQWAEEFIEECAAFPNAARDDMGVCVVPSAGH